MIAKNLSSGVWTEHPEQQRSMKHTNERLLWSKAAGDRMWRTRVRCLLSALMRAPNGHTQLYVPFCAHAACTLPSRSHLPSHPFLLPIPTPAFFRKFSPFQYWAAFELLALIYGLVVPRIHFSIFCQWILRCSFLALHWDLICFVSFKNEWTSRQYLSVLPMLSIVKSDFVE